MIFTSILQPCTNSNVYIFINKNIQTFFYWIQNKLWCIKFVFYLTLTERGCAKVKMAALRNVSRLSLRTQICRFSASQRQLTGITRYLASPEKLTHTGQVLVFAKSKELCHILNKIPIFVPLSGPKCYHFQTNGGALLKCTNPLSIIKI